jgi:hypothetical protein
MKRLRISGLVGLAKRIRQELAGPVAPERLAQIRGDVADAVAMVEQLLRETHSRVQGLPAPSRKAYQFLKGLDLDAVVVDASGSTASFPPDSVSFHGLQRHFDSLLNQLARALRPIRAVAQLPAAGDRRSPPRAGVPQRQPDEIYEIIRSDSASIEEEIRAQNIRPEQLRKAARQMRGWFAYFSQREHFERYCAAVQRAEPAFRAVSGWAKKEPFDIVVHFRPMRGMYHIFGYADWALVQLPTPAICFSEEVLRAVAHIAFKKGGDRKAVHDAAGGEAYHRIAAALERLGGVVTQARGVQHDLDASFDRVNAAYFQGAMSRPHLVWSRTFATRKFGHYEIADDTIMVNMVLDRPTVPEFVIDLIVYHELLHKQIGITWKNNRVAAHTPELARRERQFKHYDEAKAILRKLASER